MVTVDLWSVEFDGKGFDVFVTYAEDMNGRPLTEDELNELPARDLLNRQVYGD